MVIGYSSPFKTNIHVVFYKPNPQPLVKYHVMFKDSIFFLLCHFKEASEMLDYLNYTTYRGHRKSYMYWLLVGKCSTLISLWKLTKNCSKKKSKYILIVLSQFFVLPPCIEILNISNLILNIIFSEYWNIAKTTLLS